MPTAARRIPLEHRLEEVVLGAGGHHLDIDAANGLVEQRLQCVAQLGVSQQVLDVVGAGGVGEHHGRNKDSGFRLQASGIRAGGRGSQKRGQYTSDFLKPEA
jgi:hypothetical protein